MDKIKILIVAVVLLAATVNAQSPLDSLVKDLNNYTTEDTVRATKLNTISRKFADAGDAETGVRYADSSIALCTKINSEVKLATAYYSKAYNLSALGKDTPAIEWYKKSYTLNEELDREMACGSILHNMGILYFNLSDYINATDCQNKALSIFTKLKYDEGIAACLNSNGVIYMYISDYPKALESYFESLKISESLADTLGIAQAYSNIGLTYNYLTNTFKALEYHKKALDLSIKIDDSKTISKCYNNMANVYSDIKEENKALELYQKALVINQEANYTFGIAGNFSNLGIAYSTLGSYELALEHLQKAIPMFEEIGDRNNLAVVLNEIGTVYSKAPESLLKKYSIKPNQRIAKAVEIKTRALEINKEVGNINSTSDIYEDLSTLYSEQKEFKKALESYKQFITLRDSIVNDEKKVAIARREMQYDFDKKQALAKANHDNELALADAEISKQRIIKNSAMAGGVILLIAGVTSFSFYKRRRDAVQQKTESDFKAQVSDTEMKALRAQMNPHFIFNSLNSITDCIDKHDSNTASLFTTKFAKLMRLILENSEQKEVALADDLKALELYMQLESLRMNNKFSYSIHVDDDIDKETTLVPPLILQPFVENSIWHGISKKEGTGKIKISIKKEAGMIKCIIEDNGVGRKKSALLNTSETLSKKKSLGMKITKSRIEIINKIKKSKAGVELFDLAEGMRVEVLLPLELSF